MIPSYFILMTRNCSTVKYDTQNQEEMKVISGGRVSDQQNRKNIVEEILKFKGQNRLLLICYLWSTYQVPCKHILTLALGKFYVNLD